MLSKVKISTRSRTQTQEKALLATDNRVFVNERESSIPQLCSVFCFSSKRQIFKTKRFQ